MTSVETGIELDRHIEQFYRAKTKAQRQEALIDALANIAIRLDALEEKE